MKSGWEVYNYDSYCKTISMFPKTVSEWLKITSDFEGSGNFLKDGTTQLGVISMYFTTSKYVKKVKFFKKQKLFLKRCTYFNGKGVSSLARRKCIECLKFTVIEKSLI